MNQTDLIKEITKELKPVKRLKSSGERFLLWAQVVTFLTLLGLLLNAQFRIEWFTQLADHPRFLLETFFGFLSFIMGARIVFQLSVPGQEPKNKFLGLLPLVGFTAFLLYGYYDPALVPSMVGKRPFCFYETLFFGAASFLVLIFLVNRAAPLKRFSLALIAGGACASLPAAFMQIACMYDPRHILTHHIFPIYIIMGLACLLYRLIIRKFN